MDLKGTIHGIEQNDHRQIRAFLFLSTELPISNKYINALNDLYAKSVTLGNAVEYFEVVSNPTVSRI